MDFTNAAAESVKADAEAEGEEGNLPEFAFVLDTDAGCDPDDIIAVLCAVNFCKKRHFPLAIVTSDETPKQDRAIFVRSFVPDLSVTVISGAISDERSGKVSKAILDHNEEIRSTCRVYPSPVLMTFIEMYKGSKIVWIGIGSMTNLSQIISTADDDAFRPHRVVQMAGRIEKSAGADSVEYNVKLDPEACAIVLRQCCNLLTFIPIDTTGYFLNWLAPESGCPQCCGARRLQRGEGGAGAGADEDDRPSLFCLDEVLPEGSLAREAVLRNISGYKGGMYISIYVPTKTFLFTICMK